MAIPVPPAPPSIEAAKPPPGIPLTVAAVSMNARTDKAENLKLFERYMKETASKGAHLVVFPEIALQQNPGWGMSSDRPTPEEQAYVEKTAEPVPGESTRWLVEKSREHGIYVVFGMTERGEDGKLYNVSVFLGPEGVLGHYRKNALWDTSAGGNEHLFWERGAERGTVVDSPIGKVGLIICREMSYNFGRELKEKGVEILVTVSAWPALGGYYFDQAVIKNAEGCNCWHIVADQYGTVGYALDYGHSKIVDPTGKVIVDAGAEPGLVIAQTGRLIDPKALPKKIVR